MISPRISLWFLAPVLAAWGLAVGAGHLLLDAHATRPGDPGEPARRWPAGSLIVAEPARSNLLIFLHPRCPCSRASVAELGEVLGRTQGRTAVHVVLLRHVATQVGAGGDLGWIAESLPGARVWDDPGGVESRRFGVATSGHVLIYGEDGRIAFRGGITPSRGHRGANLGRDAIFAWLRDRRPARAPHPVFGCPLDSPFRTTPL